MPCSKAVYRSILREASKLSVWPVRHKICFNTREVFDLHRAESDGAVIRILIEDGYAAVRVIAWLNRLPQVCGPPFGCSIQSCARQVTSGLVPPCCSTLCVQPPRPALVVCHGDGARCIRRSGGQAIRNQRPVLAGGRSLSFLAVCTAQLSQEAEN